MNPVKTLGKTILTFGVASVLAMIALTQSTTCAADQMKGAQLLLELNKVETASNLETFTPRDAFATKYARSEPGKGAPMLVQLSASQRAPSAQKGLSSGDTFARASAKSQPEKGATMLVQLGERSKLVAAALK